MKKSAAFALAILLLAACGPKPIAHKAVFSEFTYEGHDTFYEENPLTAPDQVYNPILQGWYSDPSICPDGKGNYYLATSTFAFYPGVPIFKSADLVNWEQVGNILTTPGQMEMDRQAAGTGGIYASSIFRNGEDWYMITTNMGGLTAAMFGYDIKYGNFLVKAKSPEGPWSDPVGLDNMPGIDPSMFFDEDGKAYLLYCRINYPGDYPGHCSIHLQEYDTLNDKVLTETDRIIADKGARPEDKPTSLEGPHLYKINGKYYLLCAEGGTELRHSEVVFRSDNVWGPYEAWEGNPMLTQRGLADREEGVFCAGHADIFQDAEGNWWSVFLGTRRIGDEVKMENLGRETFLMPLRWTEDGWPYITREGEAVPRIVTVPGAVRQERSTFNGNFAVKEAFDSKELAPYWMTIRTAALDLYSLTEKPGSLVLACGPVMSEVAETPAFVGRRLQHHRFSATATMVFEPEEGERAGLALFKSEGAQYLLARKKDRMSLVQVTPDGENLLASAPCKASSVLLKVASDTGTEFVFSFSENGGKTWTVLADDVDAGYLATIYSMEGGSHSSSFCGTIVGMFAEKR